MDWQNVAAILEAINHELIDCTNSVKAVQEEPVLACLPGCQSGLHALRQGAGGGGFIELVLWSGQRSQHAHWNRTNITMKQSTVPRLVRELQNNAQSLASSYFSQGWRSSWSSRWSGDPSSAARSLPSRTGPSNSLAEPTDAPRPEQKGITGSERNLQETMHAHTPLLHFLIFSSPTSASLFT